MASTKKNVVVSKEVEEKDHLPATVPDYIVRGKARGAEDVGTKDMTIPRVEIAQALTPALNRNKPEYIEGLEVGYLYNTVTRENYGPGVTVCPVYFKPQYLVWRDRKKGGGFRGAFDSMEQAHAAMNAEGLTVADGWEAIQTGQHYVMIEHNDVQIPAVISMARTKLKVSKNWNTVIRLTSSGDDTFSRTYRLSTVEEKKEKGDYFNYKVAPLGYPSMELYKSATAFYNSISDGTNVVIDMSDADAQGTDSGTEY